MPVVATALFLDFDNVFSGLVKLDPKLAMRFAQTPSVWLDRLASELLNDGRRRWLVLRCYMNPSGSVASPEGSRIYFSTFRASFTDAGFEVVDCPRLTHTKNGADIRLVLDAAESLRADVRYDEFVIASGDSDMTPLLVRLRAADRRITVMSPADSAQVLGAIADRLVGGEEVLELIDDRRPELLGAEGSGDDAGPTEPTPELRDAEHAFEELVRGLYEAAPGPLNMATVAQQVIREIGGGTIPNRWFGHGTFANAITAVELPDLRMSQHFIWDFQRHDPPVDPERTSATAYIPPPVALLNSELRLPKLRQECWRPIHEGLAEYVSTHEFNINDTTRWVRDRLAEAGIEVPRSAVNFVSRGATFGGCPLYRDPTPDADEIAAAFVRNVLERAAASDVELTLDDKVTLRAWFGAGSSS